MKFTAFFFIGLTSLYLILFVAFCQVQISVSVLNVMFLVGNALLLLMVYKILKDNYKTNKSFENWYEDHSRIEEQ